MHILIAPNAFKNSIDAMSAAKAIEKGLLSGYPSCTTTLIPVGDGGDGTGKLLTDASKGILIEHTVHDPLGRTINASYGLIDDKTAVIEMAAASGLRLLKNDERDPLHATSFGTGELMLHALNNGAEKILLGVGGSATVDGGCGILQALGIRFLDEQQQEIKNIPADLGQLSFIDLSRLDQRIKSCELVILCDVTNPLLGEKGAATIFGPQKGASPEQVIQLEHCMHQLQHIILKTTGKNIGEIKHGGAAGGVTAGLCGLINAKAVNGIEYFLDHFSFDDALVNADLVITGEGSIDLQTLDGKAPYGVAMRAKKKNVPVIALTGKMPDTAHKSLQECFDRIININDGSIAENPLAATAINLERTAKELVKRFK